MRRFYQLLIDKKLAGQSIEKGGEKEHWNEKPQGASLLLLKGGGILLSH